MKLMRINQLFSFEKGSLQSSKCISGDYDFITAASEWKTHNEYTHNCEALIFAAAASGSLGRTHYVKGKFVSSDLCFIITPKDSINLPVDLKFYHILFNELKDEIVRNTKAGTSKEAIGLGSFGMYELPYFDFDTQIRIKNSFVSIEESQKGLSSELNYQLLLVKKLRKQLLQDAVKGKLVEYDPNDEPASELLKKINAVKSKLINEKKLKKEKETLTITAVEIPFEIPNNWVWSSIGEISLSVSTGPFGTMLHKSDYVENGIPLVNPMNIVNGKIIPSIKMMVNKETKQKLKSYILKVGDIVIGRRGEMGRCAIVTEEENGWLCGTGSFFLEMSQYIYRPYFINVLSSGYAKSILLGTSVGATMNNLNHRILNNLPIPLPPLPEQKRIVLKMEELTNYCDALEESIKQSASQNEKLFQQVLREALQNH